MKFVFIAMVFALVSATASRADTITFSFSAPTASYAGGVETLTFAGTITASAMNAGNIFFNGDSFSIQSPLTLDDTLFYFNAPIFLSAGGTFTGDLFTVAVPYGTALGLYPGSFTLLGGADGNAYGELATADFNVAQTPEPSSIALLGTGLLGLVGVMRKRAV